MTLRTAAGGARALAAIGLAALLLAGCGAADRSSESADSGGAAPAEKAPARGAPGGAAPDRDAAAGQAGTGAPDLRVDQRAIIYTGTMRVQVDDVEAAARRAVDAVTATGGFVGGDQRRSVDASAQAELELRVPAAKFSPLVEELATYGRQQRREIRTQDVTEETVDLDARIITQRARVDSARRLLARANTVPELVSLENEVTRREADLASLEAKKRRLADLTALSTITVTFVGRDASTADEEEEDRTGFMVGLRGGWTVFLASMGVLLTVLGALLPWLLLIGVPVTAAVVLLRRRRQRRRPAPPVGPVGGGRPPTPTGPPPVPATRSAP
ncbi:protein of unknown function (DUF4349) [Micromonospora matsumotoense]|uniref:DUF4349 domain-containing protein n=1 Tax=Micromonospora matsumotoense TaxID=121616 RepID=A0A1C5AQ70_9ACTN|nr:DUF4349 domain-containing protein [Micromonospora matsumotoense]SCF47362.1 protein of unknown function (DUF4349) [Micromonospora matsumotoense]